MTTITDSQFTPEKLQEISYATAALGLPAGYYNPYLGGIIETGALAMLVISRIWKGQSQTREQQQARALEQERYNVQVKCAEDAYLGYAAKAGVGLALLPFMPLPGLFLIGWGASDGLRGCHVDPRPPEPSDSSYYDY